MTRLRLRTGPAALFGAVFVLALVALLPLRLVLGWFDLSRTGLAAREVTGSVWGGSVREARLGGIALGDLDAGVAPLPLLVGRARIGLATRDDGAVQRLHGGIEVARHDVGVDDLTASLPAGTIFAPLPVSGIDLDQVGIRFVDGRCERAEGRVKATLGGDIAGVSVAQGLSGNARCDAGALLLPLASQAGTERVALRLTSAGRFHADLTVRPVDAAAAQRLAASGFRPSPQGYVLAVDGRF